MTIERYHLPPTETNRFLVRSAQVVSWLLNPFLIPFAAFLVLFLFTYLRIMPLQSKLWVLGVVYGFTILFPTVTIFLLGKLQNASYPAMSERAKRYVPLLLTVASYTACLLLMSRNNLPWYMQGIMLASTVASILCLLINLRWKLSEHMIGMGLAIGLLVSLSLLFVYNPVMWLCIAILLAGLLGTARIILGHHTLGEVLAGFLLGYACAILSIHPAHNLLIRYFLQFT